MSDFNDITVYSHESRTASMRRARLAFQYIRQRELSLPSVGFFPLSLECGILLRESLQERERGNVWYIVSTNIVQYVQFKSL